MYYKHILYVNSGHSRNADDAYEIWWRVSEGLKLSMLYIKKGDQNI